MMNTVQHGLFLLLITAVSACDKQNEGLVTPRVDEDFPQILLLADEGDGGWEDEEEFSFVITLADVVDPSGEELGGTIVPLTTDVTVHFEISNLKGFNDLSTYLRHVDAFYEVDDCTTSADEGIDLHPVFDPNTGLGSVTFPQGVEEVAVVFETNPALFDDDTFNTEVRGLEVRLTAVDTGAQPVVANTENAFAYRMLDDEGVYGEYELDKTDPQQFGNFLALFGLVDPDIAELSVDDVEAIGVEVEYGEFKAVVVLKETEEVNECGEVETVYRELEIEGEFGEFEDEQLEGVIEFTGEVELENGAEEEFTYQGAFQAGGDRLLLTLQGAFDGEETEEITLMLTQ